MCIRIGAKQFSILNNKQLQRRYILRMVRQNFKIYKQLMTGISATNSKYSFLNFEYNFTM